MNARTTLAWIVALALAMCVACSASSHDRPAVATGTFATDDEASLSILAAKLRSSALQGDRYTIDFTGDYGYKGQYLHVAYDGVGMLDAIRLPDGPPEYAVALYDTSTLPPGHADALKDMLEEVFGKGAFDETPRK